MQGMRKIQARNSEVRSCMNNYKYAITSNTCIQLVSCPEMKTPLLVASRSLKSLLYGPLYLRNC